MRPVDCTFAAAYPGGGMKKSPLLTAVPATVATVTWPEVAAAGTGTVRLVEPALVGVANARLRLTRSLAGATSKFVPVTVNGLVPSQICGEKLVMVGGPADAAVTENDALLVADPFGVVTAIGPLVAPDGTAAASCVVLAVVTVAGVPLKVTVFDAGVALKP